MQVIFWPLHPNMVADRSKGNLSVNIGEELLERVNRVAKALGKSQAQFVKEALDERTRPHKSEVEGIAKHEEKIIERERAAQS